MENETIKLISDWIANAIKIIESGVADRLEIGKAVAYRCGNIIRIDVKAAKQ